MLKDKVKAHKYNFEDRNAFLFCYVMIGLPLIFFIVFWVYVNVDSILLAFKDANGVFTLANFGTVFDAFVNVDMYGWNLGSMLGRTVLMWFCINILCVLPSMFSSYVLYKKILGAFIFRIIFMIPTILAGIVWVMVMKHMVGLGGPIMEAMEALGIPISEEAQYNGLLGATASAFWTILFLNIFPKIIGFNIIITGAYARIPEDLFEVGRLEGVGFIKEFFKVSVPLIWPTIIVAMITNFATICTFEGGVFLYTKGNYETATMGFYIYYMTFMISGSADVMTPFYGYPAAVGVVLTCITIPIVLFGKYVLERAVETVEY